MNMTQSFKALIVSSFSGLCALPAVAAVAKVPLPANLLNTDFRADSYAKDYPEGPTEIIVGSIPFDLVRDSNDTEGTLGAITVNANTSYDIPVHQTGITTVYTLINSYWGEAPHTNASLTFYGSDGVSTFVSDAYDLTQGWNIRDYYDNVNDYNDDVNDPTIVTKTYGSMRLDRQTFILPPEFANYTLEKIVFTGASDAGAPNGQAFLAAVTVSDISSIPEPGSVVTLGFLLAAPLFRRQRENHRSKTEMGAK